MFMIYGLGLTQKFRFYPEVYGLGFNLFADNINNIKIILFWQFLVFFILTMVVVPASIIYVL